MGGEEGRKARGGDHMIENTVTTSQLECPAVLLFDAHFGGENHTYKYMFKVFLIPVYYSN